MDPRQNYRLADTLNQFDYPRRLIILEICIRDNREILHLVRAQLRAMRERRWIIERGTIEVFADWARKLGGAARQLQQMKRLILWIMNALRGPASEHMWNDISDFQNQLRYYGLTA